VEYQPNRIVAINRLQDTILCFLLFRLESSEHAVPDDKGRAVVFIQVLLVCTVVYPVVTRCGEDIFDWCRQLTYQLGVQPKLVQYFDLVRDEEYHRVEAH